MTIFVEISNSELKLLSFKKNKKVLEITDHNKIYVPIFNGEVEEIYDPLSEVIEKEKHIVFVDNSNKVIYYDMKAPNLGHEKTISICRSELVTKLNRHENLLVDYFLIKKETDVENKILTTAIPVSRAKYFVDTAKKLNIKKREIRTAYEGLFNYLSKAKVFGAKEAAIFIELKDNVIRSWVFEENEFVNVRVNRIRNESYIDYLELLSDDISKLIQFQTARRKMFGISKVYLFGEFSSLGKIKQDLSTEYNELAIEMLPLVGNLTLPNDFDYLSYIYSLGIILGDM